MLSALTFRRKFSDLTEQEVLALAISSEEDDARIYRSFAERLRADFPASAADLRRHGGRGRWPPSAADRPAPRPVWRGDPADPARTCGGVLCASSGLAVAKSLSLERSGPKPPRWSMGPKTFYRRAAARTSDAATRKLLGDLAAAEAGHERHAQGLEERHLSPDAREAEDQTARASSS
jgi:hypothetical protein